MNVATAVLPSENVILIGPKSLPSITEPTGYSSWFMMKCHPSRFGSHALPALEYGALSTVTVEPGATLDAKDVPLDKPIAPPPKVSMAPAKQTARARRSWVNIGGLPFND
jgi:hypothetical protein